MKKLLIIAFVSISSSLEAQTSVFVGSDRYLEQGDSTYYNGFLWRINNSRAFGFGDSVEIAPSGTIDTVFFQSMSERGWDTIYCFIPKGKRIEFVYNACCSAFDPYVDGERMYDKMLVHSDFKQQLYVGTWEGGAVVPKKAQSFFVVQTSKSPMTPNIYGITVRGLPQKSRPEDVEQLPSLYSKHWVFFGEPIVLDIDKKGIVKVSRLN